MSKQLGVIIGVVILALVIGAVAYTQVKKPQKSSETSMQTSPNTEESISKGSIKSLLSAGKNVTCDITYTDQPGSSGTVYVTGNKMRGDFTVNVNNKAVESHMVSDGAFAYVWSTNQGTKMKIDTLESPAPSAQSQGTDINKDVDLKCKSWIVDNSKLTPSSDVKFTDLSDFMKPASSPSASGTNNSSKSYCDQIINPQAKAACLNY